MFAPPSRKQTAQTTSIPAPVKGLNSKDAIANMDPTFALVLDNYFCNPTSVDTRNGSESWATGLPDWVETIVHYSGGGTVRKLFAVSDDSIFDVTSQAPVGAAVVTGLSNARFQWTQFATVGGAFLVMVNGADNPRLYDGSTWGTTSITGTTQANFIHINAFKNRLWFVEKNTLHVWYLPLQSIAGAASLFDLSSIFQLGGYLVAMMTWTIDDTSGVDDYAVFITSEGEVAIYKGYDPAFAATFTLVGVFRMGRPVGPRCFVKMGSDNAVICADGVVLLSKELTTDRSLSSALSYNITNLLTNDFTSYSSNFGWQPTYYPIGNKLIINVPQTENNRQYQYVMNTITGAWSTWNKENFGYNAACWDTFEDQIYFGGDGVVGHADTGENDFDNSIIADIKPAFSYFGNLGQSKLFTMVRPIFLSDGTVTPSFALCLDYNDVLPPTAPLSGGILGGSPWDTSPWDTSPWSINSLGGSQVNKDWRTIGGIGYAASLRMSTNTLNVGSSLQSIDYVYELGGVL